MFSCLRALVKPVVVLLGRCWYNIPLDPHSWLKFQRFAGTFSTEFTVTHNTALVNGDVFFFDDRFLIIVLTIVVVVYRSVR